MKNLINLFLLSTLVILKFVLLSAHSIASPPNGDTNGFGIVDPKSDLALGTVYISSINLYWQRYYCTGTLISDEIVLTAAHCLEKNNIAYSVFFGVTEIINERITAEGVVNISTDDVLGHENYEDPSIANDYKLTNNYNDIGIIFLKGGVVQKKLNYKIKPFSLYSGSLKHLLDHYSHVGIAGFGTPEKIKKNNIVEVLNQDVLSFHNKTKKNFDSDPSQILFNMNHKHGMTSGDSGGPSFVSQQDKSLVQIGVNKMNHSYQIGFFDWHVFSAGTNISFYKDWITKSIKTLGGDPDKVTWVEKLNP